MTNSVFCVIYHKSVCFTEEDDESFVDQVFMLLINMVGNGKVSAVGRDNAIELLIKHVTWKEGVNWTNKFLKHDGMSWP